MERHVGLFALTLEDLSVLDKIDGKMHMASV
jgi:hypothetical protein